MMEQSADHAEQQQAEHQLATIEAQIVQQLTQVTNAELQQDVAGQLADLGPQKDGEDGHVVVVECGIGGDQVAGELNIERQDQFGQVESQLPAMGDVKGQLVEQVEGQIAGQVEGQLAQQVQGQLAEQVQNQLAGQVEGQLVAVAQVGGQLSTVEGQLASVGQVGDQITTVEGQLVAVEQGEDPAGLTVVDDDMVERHIVVDERVKNHITEIETQLRHNVQTVQALQQQNQEITEKLNRGKVSLALLQSELDGTNNELIGTKNELIACQENNKKGKNQQVIELARLKQALKEKEVQLGGTLNKLRASQEENQKAKDQFSSQENKLAQSLAFLQIEFDGIKNELLASRAENKKGRGQISTQKDELAQLKQALKAQDEKLQEKENILEQVEAELREYIEKYENEEAKTPSKPAAAPRIHNTRSKGKAKTATPAKTEEEEPAKKRPDFEPTTLRFCRTCGAKQLFKVKNEIIELLSGKKELSSKRCAICGNNVSPPKPPSKETNPSETLKSTDGAVAEKRKHPEPKTSTRSAKKRKHSETAIDILESLTESEVLDKSDKENECEDEQLTLCEYPLENTPDVAGDNEEKFTPMEESKEEDAEAGIEAGAEADNIALEEMDIQVDDKMMVEEEMKLLEFPRDRKPGRPKKQVKERKKKGERTPSTAPSSSELKPLCEANDDTTLFLDGREKHNRVMYALMGLDPLVKSWMAEDTKELLPFKCKECPDVEFANVRPFLKHMIKHTGDKEPMSHPYKCPDCDKTFKQSRIMQQHCMSHSDDRPFKCTFCDAAFKVRSGLWRHVKIHTNPKQHLCNICGQRFQEKRKLQNHEMIHSGELPYKCQHCGEGFRRIESMRRHEKTHTGERPHVCDVCGRTFKERGDIKKHLLLHTGEKPFKCSLCSYRSNRKEYVKLHMKTHGAGNIFKCPHCELTFSSHHACKKHEKEHFEVQVAENQDESGKDEVQEQQVIPTTLIIKQGDHPHQEMLSAVDFLLQFDSANRVFASAPGQEGTVTYVTQNPNAEDGQEPTVAYVTQGEPGQEGMVTYVTQHTTSDTGEETVTYVTEAAHPVGDGEATTVAYITEDAGTEGGNQEATITYVTQTE